MRILLCVPLLYLTNGLLSRHLPGQGLCLLFPTSSTYPLHALVALGRS